MGGPKVHHSSLAFSRRSFKAHFWVALTLSLSVFVGTPNVGSSVSRGSTESLVDGNNKKFSRVEERFFPGLFELSQGCIDSLYGNGIPNTDTAACNCSGVPRPASILSFVDVPTVMYGVAPYVAHVIVSSPGSECSDILEALFMGKDLQDRQVVFLGHVEALGEDSYRIMGKITSPGTYELRVRTLWKDFSPLSSCRPCRSCLQEEPWGMMSTNQVIRPIVVLPTIETFSIPQRSKIVKPIQGESQTNVHPCKTMDELMDGLWVWNSSSPHEAASTDINDMLRRNNNTDVQTNKKLNPFSSSWSPNTCSLEIFNASYLQTAFRGKHLHFVGDSTLHEILRLLLILFGVSLPIYPTTPPCQYRNRVFDSKFTYPTRFSFAWVGGPHPCDNGKGIVSLISGDGKQQFVDRYQKDADFVIVNSGLHDVSVGHSVEAYADAIPRFFDLLLCQANVTADRKHVIWLSSKPKTHSFGRCPRSKEEDNNGGLLWMNYLAGRIARSNYGFTVMDSHRLVKAANLVSVPKGGTEQCGDGHHCIGCDSCWAKALILVQYMVYFLVKAPK
jgi:hypothetical protein